MRQRVLPIQNDTGHVKTGFAEEHSMHGVHTAATRAAPGEEDNWPAMHRLFSILRARHADRGVVSRNAVLDNKTTQRARKFPGTDMELAKFRRRR